MKAKNSRGRRDAVVVLARGRGVRMGGPKAGLILPGDGRTFLARILDLYKQECWPVVVVTFPGGSEGCLAAAQGREVNVLEGPETGDTALTVLTAWRRRTEFPETPTHWWAHPVDLPLVASSTIGDLVFASRSGPDRVVRPVFEDQVGHPVVLPTGVIVALDSECDWHGGPLKHFLDHRQVSGPDDPALTVTVPDEGIVRDFDEPADLAAWRP